MEQSTTLINSDLTYLILKELYGSEKTPSEIAENIKKPLASINNYFVKLNKLYFIEKTKKDKQRQYYKINYVGIMDYLYDQDIKTTTQDEINVAEKYFNITNILDDLKKIEEEEKKEVDVTPKDLISINTKLKKETFQYFKFYLDEYFKRVESATLKDFYESFYLELTEFLSLINKKEIEYIFILCNGKKYYNEFQRKITYHKNMIQDRNNYLKSEEEQNQKRPSLMNMFK